MSGRSAGQKASFADRFAVAWRILEGPGAVLLYTGLRRGDAVRLGRQHVRHGVASVRTEKSQGQIEVTIPILPDLQEAIDAGPTGDLAYICGERGQ
jgi:integrase